MDVVLRVGKALVVAAVAFGSAWAITGSVRIGLLFGAVPLVLGTLNILTTVAYSVTALAFLLAVSVQIMGLNLKVEAVRWLDEVKRTLDAENQNTSVSDKSIK